MSSIPKYVSEIEYTKGRGTLTPELRANMEKLLEIINQVRHEYGKPFFITSGYRTPEHNAAIGGAKNSAHTKCLAIDIADPNGLIGKWIINNNILEKYDLYMESLDVTQKNKNRSWVHLDLIPRKNRIFMP